jgi:hypothetical protein
MLGNGFYVSRDAETAGIFGKVQTSTLSLRPSEVLQINDQSEYNAFITQALQKFPGNAQEAMPAFAKSLGYKAVEVSPNFDKLGGINVLDKSAILNTSRPYNDLQSKIEAARNAGNTAQAKKLAEGLPDDIRAGMGFDTVKTSRHLEVDPVTGKVTIKP